MLNGRKIQLKIKRFKSVVTDVLLEQNILRGNLDYTKFIILGRSRTGSNLLVNLLQSHPRIRVFYELFSEDYQPNFSWDFIGKDLEKIWQLKQENPGYFLEKLIFRSMPQYISAVGFKLFYYHAQKGKDRGVWNYLKNARKIKIIHLKRKNILKTYVSQETALITNNWVSQDKLQRTITPLINLDYNLVNKVFEKTRQREQEAEQLFSRHQIMNVIYEDVVKDYAKETKRIQDFLEIEYQPLYISTRKQAHKSLSEQIHNYEDLKIKFAHTPWEEFFE